MHQAVFTAKEQHTAWLRVHFISVQRRKIWMNCSFCSASKVWAENLGDHRLWHIIYVEVQVFTDNW